VSVDRNALARLRASTAKELLSRFMERRRRDVATLREALECGDFETIGSLGHNMSGNGVSYGFPEISEIGKRLEAAAVTGNAMAVREQLTSLEACVARNGDEEAAMETAPRTESCTRVRLATGDADGISQKSGKR
jgi:HPt (histidine-containing phosphotransfer) domain-containing protein